MVRSLIQRSAKCVPARSTVKPTVRQLIADQVTTHLRLPRNQRRFHNRAAFEMRDYSYQDPHLVA